MNALHYATALLEPQTTFILEDHNLTHFIYLSYDAPLPHFISSCARHGHGHGYGQGLCHWHEHEHAHVSFMRTIYHAFCLTKPTLPRPLQVHKYLQGLRAASRSRLLLSSQQLSAHLSAVARDFVMWLKTLRAKIKNTNSPKAVAPNWTS